MTEKMAQIKIVDLENQDTLYTFSLDQENEAYEKLNELASFGVEGKIIIPNVTERLISQLTNSTEEIEKYKKSAQAECENHD